MGRFKTTQERERKKMNRKWTAESRRAQMIEAQLNKQKKYMANKEERGEENGIAEG